MMNDASHPTSSRGGTQSLPEGSGGTIVDKSQPTNSMKDYGNGIHASSDWLADIARQCIEREMMQRQARLASYKDDDDSGQWGIWNISDRH